MAQELLKVTNETDDRFDLVPKVVDILNQAEPGASMTIRNITIEELFETTTYSYKFTKRDDGRFDVRLKAGKNADVDSIPAII